MNEAQVVDVVNYLATIQISQQAAVDKTPAMLTVQTSRLEGADFAVELAIVNQEQVVAEVEQAPDDRDFIVPITDSAGAILDSADIGIDTDGDNLSDTAEVELSEISTAAVDYYREVDAIALDPAVPDAEKADEAIAQLEGAIEKDPILKLNLAAIEEILATDEITEENPDTDGDGLSDAAENGITGQMAQASAATIPSSISEVDLDPTNPESVTGVPDLDTANALVGGMESTSINVAVAVENVARILPQQENGLVFLKESQELRLWEIDIPGVAAEMEVGEDEALRAVTLFNANCARCHTASFSAGVPYTGPVGSGGFGPALWDGRPIVQFGQATEDSEDDLLIKWLVKGSENEEPYGINGFGSGRMPGFGSILAADDIELLAKYLRSSNLDGME